MTKRSLITIMIVFALFISSAEAQKAKKHHPQKGQKAMKEQMDEYVRENIVPVAKIQRLELDEQISDTDKARLKEIKTEINEQNVLIKEKRLAMRATQTDPTVEQRKEMRELRNSIHDLMNEVGELSEKYHTEIFAALRPLKENAETWKLEMMELRKQGVGQKPQRPNKQKADRPQGKRPEGMRSEKRKTEKAKTIIPMHRLFSPESFLLWNPEEPLPGFEENNKAETAIKINLFPNPASTSVQVSVELKEEQNLQIDLMQQNGQVVATEENPNASKGVNTHTFNLSDLENGIYFIKVKAGDKTKVERLIIQK